MAANLTVITPLDSGPGSLRAAMASASDGDVITISPVLSGVTIELFDQIDVDRDVTITGVDAPGVTVDANATGRVFFVEPGTRATIAHLTITGGDFPGGGAVYNRGDLTLAHCTISGNHSPAVEGAGHDGGAINNGAVNQPARLVLDHCVVTGNTTDGWGGGLANVTFGATIAEMEIRNSSITFNQALAGGGVASRAQGGGVCKLTIVDSVVSWNTADGWGGGVRVDRTSSHPHALSVATITTTDIQGNQAGGRGGGLATVYGAARVTLAGCGVTDNTATDGAPDLAQYTDQSSVAFLGDNWIGSTEGLFDPPSTPSDQLDVGGMPAAGWQDREGGAPDAGPPGVASPDANPLAPALSSAPGATSTPSRPSLQMQTPPRDRAGLASIPDPAAGPAAAEVVPHGPISGPATRVTLQVTDAGDSGPGTLREAVAAAAPGDAVVFAPELAGATIALASPIVIDLDGELSISAADAPGATLDGGDATRLLEIGTDARVTVFNLAFRHGNGDADDGGAISNRGDLTLLGCELTDNRATGWGGAIYNRTSGSHDTARLTLHGCTLRRNVATADGGAIANIATLGGIASLRLVDTTVAENSGVRGGGIWSQHRSGAAAVVVLDQVDLLDNDGFYSGGGLRLHDGGDGTVGWARVVDSTITGNQTGNSGGGVAILSGRSHADFRGCTILGNQADSAGPDLAQGGSSPALVFRGDNRVGTIAGVERYAATASDVLGSATSVADDPAGPHDDAPGATPSAPAAVAIAPNPFNPRTTVQFTLPASGEAAVEILDLRGRVVARPWQGEVRARETVDVRWDGTTADRRAASSGVYLFRVVGPDGVQAVERGTLVR